MDYHQLTSGERDTISALRIQGFTPSEIGDELSRHGPPSIENLSVTAVTMADIVSIRPVHVPEDDVQGLGVTITSDMKISKLLTNTFAKNRRPMQVASTLKKSKVLFHEP